MEKISIVKRLLTLVLLSFISFAYSQGRPPVPGGAGGGIVGPGAPEETPIDMYEGGLMIVATSMIAGCYFVRNRRQIN